MAAALVLILLVACSGGKHQARRVPPTSTTTAPTATTAPPPTTRPGPQPCTTAGLAIAAGEGGAGLGHWSLPILFRNTSPAKCRLTGYPGVAGLDDTGRQTAQARRSPNGFSGGLGFENQTPPTVDLAPGETASALVEGTNVPQDSAPSCPQYAALLVTPPGETHSVKLAAGENGCSGLEVHPVLPGTSGSVRQ